MFPVLLQMGQLIFIDDTIKDCTGSKEKLCYDRDCVARMVKSLTIGTFDDASLTFEFQISVDEMVRFRSGEWREVHSDKIGNGLKRKWIETCGVQPQTQCAAAFGQNFPVPFDEGFRTSDGRPLYLFMPPVSRDPLRKV